MQFYKCDMSRVIDQLEIYIIVIKKIYVFIVILNSWSIKSMVEVERERERGGE